jgi:hypothetical protein
MKQTLVDQAIPSLMSDVTQILARIESGDPVAADQLLPLVYDELRKLAAARMTQDPYRRKDFATVRIQAYGRSNPS